MSFNIIDFLLLLIILLSVWGGWHRGFILGLLDLTRWILSFLAALYFYQPVAHFLDLLTGWSEIWTQPLAFILLIFLAGLIIQSLGAYLLRRLPKDVHKHRANHILGVLPGFACGLITAAIISALLLSIPFSDGLQEKLLESPAANRLAEYTDILETTLTPIFEEPIKTLNRRTTIEPGSNETVQLPFKTESFKPRPDLEEQMLELVNQERTSRGLPPLAPDPEMTEVARKHSADMFQRGYFSHYTPEGKDPFDRMKEDEITFRTAGENLALAPTLKIAHNGLMESPGHRENILRPQFGRLGIGILDGGRLGLMISQEFRN
ncbi:MAG TPA: CvpA family protein [Pyrinomonadaceae bacterium]|jgi:uncharacterized protein YkwD